MQFWRKWHRWLGTIAAVLLVIIGLTGIFLQVDEVAKLSAPAKVPPFKEMAPIAPAEMAQKTQAILATGHQDADIRTFALRAGPTGPMAVVRLAGEPKTLYIDMISGNYIDAKIADPQPERTFLQRVRTLMINLHTFGLVGVGGHIAGIALSIILAILSASGLWMWWQMRRDRAKRNLSKWFWN
ncbi:MAG: PepSY-associated TM helix domain-containing protein [Sphingobium sp.]|nr:PepSY domain-containing protein [Sphingobium sp.]MCP5397822.1 PepSY domain-containing protein [Sphingomonas sp.]